MKKTPPMGLTNKIKIQQKVFIKQSSRIVDYYLNRKNEQKFYSQVQNISFIKVPYQMRRNWRGTWISKMVYYPEATLINFNLYQENDWKKMKKLIDDFHQLELDLTIFNPKTFLQLFTKQVAPIPELEPFTPIINKLIFEYYDDAPKLVVSHNDLTRENFLVINQKVYLIDFDYVSLNHPLFDYASFMSETCTQEQAKAFVKVLKLKPQELVKLEKIILYQNFLWAYWAKYMFLKTNKKVYHEIMNSKIDQALTSPLV